MTASTAPRTWGGRRLVLAGAVAGLAAAACTAVAAAIARAGGVSLEVQAEPIPVAAFALWTLVGAAVELAAAEADRPGTD